MQETTPDRILGQDMQRKCLLLIEQAVMLRAVHLSIRLLFRFIDQVNVADMNERGGKQLLYCNKKQN